MSVSEFGVVGEPGTEPDLDEWSELPQAHVCTARLGSALAAFGYEANHVTDAKILTDAPGIGGLVIDQIRQAEPESVLIVHVASHGVEAERSKSLLIVGPDGNHDVDTDVETWVRAIEDRRKQRPLTLFLIDACHAGITARLPWQYDDDVNPRAFTLAAALPAHDAYDCAFTAAVAQALEDITSQTAGLDPSVEYVGWLFFVDRVRNLVMSTQVSADQHVVGTLLDSDKAPAFFRNPAFREPDEVQQRLRELPGPLVEFADDELIDPTHFTDRAGGRLGDPAPDVGLFTGRATELRDLTGWLDEDETSTGGRIRIVTGSPGAGKSALLGVIVCAAHPALRELTKSVWQHLDAPTRHPELAAIHVRRRSLSEVFASGARQWGLTAPESGWTTVDFVGAVADMDIPPVLVLDALDEAENALSIITNFLRPLITGTTSDGRALCRVLLGTRSGVAWQHIQDLINEVARDNEIVDLDRVDVNVLQEDIRTYAEAALQRTAPYDAAALTMVRRRITGGLAETLASAHSAGHETSAAGGAFLVATLFLNFMLQTPAPKTNSEADQLLSRLPRSLPEVLELDLASDSDRSDVRGLMCALAIAEGDGAPLTVLTSLREALTGMSDGESASGTTTRSAPQKRTLEVLNRVRFYLRSTVDSDGTSLFRLFHQGLADHLTPEVTPALRERAWAGLVDRQRDLLGIPRWGSAEPYLKRHAFAHARSAGRLTELLQDWEFVVAADPDRLLNAFQEVDVRTTLSTRAVYRSTAVEGGVRDSRRRRSRLAVDAARLGDVLSANTIMADEGLRLCWSTGGGLLSDRHVGEFIGSMSSARPLGGVTAGARSLVISGESDGHLRIWDVATREQTGQPIQGHVGPVWSVTGFSEAHTHAGTEDWDGTMATNSFAFASGGEDGRVRCWHIAASKVDCANLHTFAEPVWALASSGAEGGTIVLAGSRDGLLAFIDCARMATHTVQAHSGGIVQIASTEVEGTRYAITASHDRSVKVWNVDTRQQTGTLLSGGPWVGAIACSMLDNRPVVLLGAVDGSISAWDIQTHERMKLDLDGHSGRVGALATSTNDDGVVVVSGGYDATVRRWQLPIAPSAHRRDLAMSPSDEDGMGTIEEVDHAGPSGQVMRGHRDRIGAIVAFSDPPGVAVSRGRGQDSSLRVWDLRNYATSEPFVAHDLPVLSVVNWAFEAGDVAITAGMGRQAWEWNVATGRATPSVVGDRVMALGAIRLGDRPILVMGTTSGLRILDFETKVEISYDRRRDADGNPIAPPIASEVSCVQINNTPCAIFADGFGRLAIFNLKLGNVRGKRLPGGSVDARTTATIRLAPGTAYAAAHLQESGLRIWDLGNPTSHVDPPTAAVLFRRGVQITATAMFADGDDAVVIATYSDRIARMWSARTGRPWGSGRLDVEGIGRRIAIRPGKEPVAAISTTDGSVRFWDLKTLRKVASPLYLPGVAVDLTFTSTGRLVLTYGVEVTALDLDELA